MSDRPTLNYATPSTHGWGVTIVDDPPVRLITLPPMRANWLSPRFLIAVAWAAAIVYMIVHPLAPTSRRGPYEVPIIIFLGGVMFGASLARRRTTIHLTLTHDRVITSEIDTNGAPMSFPRDDRLSIDVWPDGILLKHPGRPPLKLSPGYPREVLLDIADAIREGPPVDNPAESCRESFDP